MSQYEGYVYVIRSEKNGSLYLGSTNNIHRRLQEHNDGVSPATRHQRPWRLEFAIRLSDIAYARKAEQVLKSQKRKIAVSWILEILGKHLSRYDV